MFIAAMSLGFAAEPRRAFDVPATTADKSLKYFSEQSGLEVIFPTRVTREITTKPVVGTMTDRQALDAMLADTGLMVIQDPKTGAFTVTTPAASPKNGPRKKNAEPSGGPNNKSHGVKDDSSPSAKKK